MDDAPGSSYCCNAKRCSLAAEGCTDEDASNYRSTATVDDGSCFYADDGCVVAQTTFQYAELGLAGFDYTPENFEELGYHSENCGQVGRADSGVTDYNANLAGKSGQFLVIADSDMLCMIHFDQVNIPGIYPGLQKLYLQFDLFVGETRWESSDQILVTLEIGVEDKQTVVLLDTAGWDIDNFGYSKFGLRKEYWATYSYDLSGVTAAQLSIGLDSNSAAEFIRIGNVRYTTSPCKNYGQCASAMLQKGHACECEGERAPVLTCADYDDQVCCLNATAPAFATFVDNGIVGVFQDRGGDFDFGGCSGNLTALLYAANCGQSQFDQFWFHEELYGSSTAPSIGDVDMAQQANESEPVKYIVVDLAKNTTDEYCADPTLSTSACDAVTLGTDSSASDCEDADPSCVYAEGGAALNATQLAARTCGGYVNATQCGNGTVCVQLANMSSFHAACLPPVYGCMNARATNYNPAAILHNASSCLFQYLVVCESVCSHLYAECGAADETIVTAFGETAQPHIEYCKSLLADSGANTTIYISEEDGCFSGSFSDPGAPATISDPGHPGWEGMYCGYEVAMECLSSPCLNGGTCHDGLQMYTCSCQIPYGLEALILDGDCDSRTGPIIAETQFSESEPGATTFSPTMVQHELPFGNVGCVYSTDYGVTATGEFRVRMPLRLCSVHFEAVALEPFYRDPCPNGTLADDGVNCTSSNATASARNATNTTAAPTIFNVQLNLFVPSTTWETNDYIHIVADVGEPEPVVLFSTQGVDLDNCTAVAEACARYVPMTSYTDPETEKVTQSFWGSTFFCDPDEELVPTCLVENSWCVAVAFRRLHMSTDLARALSGAGPR